MSRVAGCQIEPLDHLACKAWLDHALGHAGAPADLGNHAWVLCHSDDGVTWGRRGGEGWHLASTVFPDLCPVPSETGLQEMRVFSPEAEVLIWRTEESLCGRVLRDTSPGDVQEALRPDTEDRLLLSGRVSERRDGFTRVCNGAGAEQILPLRVAEGPSSRWPRLRVRHYFARDDKTGCVRVAATRLVEVR